MFKYYASPKERKSKFWDCIHKGRELTEAGCTVSGAFFPSASSDIFRYKEKPLYCSLITTVCVKQVRDRGQKRHQLPSMRQPAFDAVRTQGPSGHGPQLPSPTLKRNDLPHVSQVPSPR